MTHSKEPTRRDSVVKTSKAGKARVKRASVGEKAKVKKAARTLADFELITAKRYEAIVRALK